MADKKIHVVVIGNGMAGYRFCEKLLEYDAYHKYRITVFGDELLPAYDRVALSSTFSGTHAADLVFSEARWYAYHQITLNIGARIESINPEKKTVSTTDKKETAYDRLVIATGARPLLPDHDGSDLNGVHVYRTASDAEAILKNTNKTKNAVVIGGGLLGIETAVTCKKLGLRTTILEQASWLLPNQLNADGGSVLKSQLETSGLSIMTNAHVSHLKGKADVHHVCFNNDTQIPAELVIYATGIKPNSELGITANLSIETNGGIAIDECARTSDSNIYAIGECASYRNRTFGLVSPCYAMAEAAAAHLGGINKTFTLQIPASSLTFEGFQVASLGEIKSASNYDIVDQDLSAGVFKKLFLCADGKKLIGAILIGEASEFTRLQKFIEEQRELPADPKELLAPIGSPLVPELDIEEDDIVCFCNYVTRGDICRAIDQDKLETTDDVMAVTFAASLCGSCYEQVDRVTQYHLGRHQD